MTFKVDYTAIDSVYALISKQCDSWSDSLNKVKDSLEKLINSNSITGKGADNIKLYLSNTHLMLIDLLISLIDAHKNNFFLYKDDYYIKIDNSILTNIDENEICDIQQKLKFFCNQSIAVDYEVNKAIAEISDIFYVHTKNIDDVSANYEILFKHIDKIREDVNSFENHHIKSDFNDTEALNQYINKFISQLLICEKNYKEQFSIKKLSDSPLYIGLLQSYNTLEQNQTKKKDDILQAIDRENLRVYQKKEYEKNKKNEKKKFLQKCINLLTTIKINPFNFKAIKNSLWSLWDTETGNKIEKSVVSFLLNDMRVSDFLAFEYDNINDLYYTNECYGIQRLSGFCDIYDDLGVILGMDLDTEKVIFNANGKEYRLQFWKGSYAFKGAYGAEIGLYSRSEADAKRFPYNNSIESKFYIYDCVNGEDEIETTQYIYNKKGTLLLKHSTKDYADNDDHFWNLAIKTDGGYSKHDLCLKEIIEVKDDNMRDAMLEALNKNISFKVTVNQNNKNQIIVEWR